MKVLSILIALIAITTLELQATNPCLCEYWLSKFNETGDSIYISTKVVNRDVVKIDTCSTSSTKGKYFTQKGNLVFQGMNPFNSSSFTVNQIITENDIDSVNYPYTKTAIKAFLNNFGSCTITAIQHHNNYNLLNRFEFKINFDDYVNKDLLDSIGNNLDTVPEIIQRCYFYCNGPGALTSISFEKEFINYQIVNQFISFNEIYDEVTIIDLLGRSNSYKLTDKINLQEMDEKIYILIARKGDKYFKTKLILE